MALKVELKPGERVIIGDCVVTNSAQRTRLLIEGQIPILREKDIMTPERATSPAKRIYLAIQRMYLDKDPNPHHELYVTLIRDIVDAAPSTSPYIDRINDQISAGAIYKALKEARKLIGYETELIAAACEQGPRDVRTHSHSR